MMKNLKLFLIILFLLSLQVEAKKIIVAGSGGNFTKIQDAIDAASAGDTIWVREKSTPYYESINFTNGGDSLRGYIILRAYPLEHPVIDGSNVDFGDDGEPGLIKIVNKSYIIIEDFEIRNLETSDAGVFPAGIWISGACDHIQIINNDIHGIRQKNANGGAHGIAVYGTDAVHPIKELTLWDNEIYDCNLGSSEAVALNGNVENFVVKCNDIHDVDNIGFDFIGYEGTCPTEEYDRVRNGLVEYNTAFNVDSRNNPAYNGEGSAGGFYVDGGKNIIFDGNTAYNCNIAFEIASEHGGKDAEGIIVRNNFLFNNHAAGISIGGYDSQRGNVVNCAIVNNTLYKNHNESFNWGAEFFIQYFCNNIFVRNNIFYSDSNSALIDYSNTTGTNLDFDYNLYYSESGGKFIWQNSEYGSFNDFQTGTGLDSNSLFADPMLDEYSITTHLIPFLKEVSPAIDRGVNLPDSLVGIRDFVGFPRIVFSNIDIGAIEFDIPIKVEDKQTHPSTFKLSNPYPNPLVSGKEKGASVTSFRFSFPAEMLGKNYSVKIYDLRGAEVKTIAEGEINKEKYLGFWDAKNSWGNVVPSGIYFLVLQSNGKSITKKIFVVK